MSQNINQNTEFEDLDSLSRSRMIAETDTNFFVEAGAGSGKTTMLVSRMVSMIEQGKDISKICAITFTRAAAGEFYSRFQKALAERSQPETGYIDRPGALPPTTEESRARCAKALAEIDLCFMGTIDSFCNMILGEHPSDAGIPSDASLMSDKEAEALYKQEYVRICRGEHGTELKERASAFRSVHRNPEDVFVRLMSFLMQNRNVEFAYQDVEIDIDDACFEIRNDLIKALRFLLAHPELQYAKNAESRAAWEKLPDVTRSISRRWSSSFPSVLSAIKALENLRINCPIDQLGPFASGLFSEHISRKKFGWTELEQDEGKNMVLLKQLRNLQYHATMSFLIYCIPVLEEVMLQRGCLTYFDYLYGLRNLLAKDAAGEGLLISYIADRHSYFLIDEFQDTNPMQAEIFFYLTAGKPQADWKACRPKPGSLFIVGDPKQSIYRFRSADVTSFLKVKELFAANAGDVLSLTRNFRSTRELCGYFNHTFSQLLPEETETQSKFPPIPLPAQAADADPKEFGGIYSYISESGSGADPELADEILTGQMIQRLTQNPDYLIRGKEDREPRMIRYSDFMLITTSKANLTRYMDHFSTLGIPTHTEGKVTFESCETLQAITQIYAAVTDTIQTAALYSVLTGPVFGLTRNDLIEYRRLGGKLTLRREPAAELCQERPAQILMQLRQLRRESLSLSPAALFARIPETFRIYDYTSADQMEIVCYTQELLRSMEHAGTVVSAGDALTYLKKLLAGEAEEERCLSLREETDAVHLANLHKVKGLEAPIILLAYAYPTSVSADYRISHLEEPAKGWIFSLKDSGSGSSANRPMLLTTKDYQEEEEKENRALKDEVDRLIYVAATRARNALIINQNRLVTTKSARITTRWKPLLDEGIPDFFESTKAYENRPAKLTKQVSSNALYQEAEGTWVLQDRSAEIPDYELRKPSNDKAASKLSEQLELSGVASAGTDYSPAAMTEAAKLAASANPAADQPESSLTPEQKAASAILHSFPTLLGTMTHRAMEMLVSSGNQIDADQMISEILLEYSTPVIQPYTIQLTAALKLVVTTMRDGGYRQQNQVPQNLLARLLAADEVHCEVPFCYREEENGQTIIWHGVMDVVYKDADGWHIVDYKTNADGKDLDSKYQGQMSAYEKAFYTMTGEKARALTYHIDI